MLTQFFLIQTFNRGCDFCKDEKPTHTIKRVEGI
jgi:hypothetical protein